MCNHFEKEIRFYKGTFFPSQESCRGVVMSSRPSVCSPFGRSCFLTFPDNKSLRGLTAYLVDTFMMRLTRNEKLLSLL